MTSTNSFRSEIQTPDLHEGPESSEQEEESSYHSKANYYENTYLHQSIN